MPILMLAELRGATPQAYAEVNERLGIRGDEDSPPGMISHVAGLTDEGLFVVDVWESEEALRGFFEEGGAVAAMVEAGIEPPQPELYPVHNLIPQGQGDEAGVLMIAELDGVGTDDYDRMTAAMPAHDGDGSQHPAVMHVVGITDTGIIAVDVWDSAESFGEYAGEQIAPAGAEVGMDAIEPRFVPVHRRLRGSAAAN